MANNEICRIFLGTFVVSQDIFMKNQLLFNDLKQSTQKNIKWIKTEKIHITWKFLGNVTQEKINEIILNLKSQNDNFKPMQISWKSLEIWPNKKSPRILALTGEDTTKNLNKNIELIETSMNRFGFPPEKKKFNIHSTIARIRNKYKIEDKYLSNFNNNLNKLEINQISVIKSNLKLNTYDIIDTIYF